MPDLAGFSIAELMDRALRSSFEAEDEMGNLDSAQSWEAISELHKREDPEILEWATLLLTSDDAWSRACGANVLGQLGFNTGAFADERFTVLTSALLAERDPRVVDTLIYAIGHLHEPKALASLLPFTKSDSSAVRLAVASSMSGDWGQQAVAALIELTTDPVKEVRDWATFAFVLSDADAPDIREALVRRLSDADPNTRAEATSALAKRHDVRCLEQIRINLGREETRDSYCHIEAAQFLLEISRGDKTSPEELLEKLNSVFPQHTG